MILVDYMTWKKSNIIKRNSHPNLVEHLPFSGTLGMKSVPSRQELPYSKGGVNGKILELQRRFQPGLILG